jgi:hypothetical protein
MYLLSFSWSITNCKAFWSLEGCNVIIDGDPCKSHRKLFFNCNCTKLHNITIENTHTYPQSPKSKMASNTAADLPPEAIAFATRMYDAARAGQLDIFQQALPAGLPANMTNEKGDSLVRSTYPHFVFYFHPIF